MKSNLLAQMGQEAMTDPLAVEPKRPTSAARSVERAHDAKVSATDSWVRGEMTSKKHDEIHKRADHVIKRRGKK